MRCVINKIMVDKEYCMSSFLALRYVENRNKDFFDGVRHQLYEQMPSSRKTLVTTSADIDDALKSAFSALKKEKLGLLLSGGMDSAILASYMQGCDAYTFRFMDGKLYQDELSRAEYYAQKYKMNLHYVDIDWTAVDLCLDDIMRTKGAPVHSIEPQIYVASRQAKADGVTMMVIGDASDYIFGGMDKLLAKDWDFDEFVNKAIYVNPSSALKSPCPMSYLFERYRQGNKIDFQKYMSEVTVDESYSSYKNAFASAEMPYVDPYEGLLLNGCLDLNRIRNGESKYLIRELFRHKYPQMRVPEKIPMPRPVDYYFANWDGPKRCEFLDDINMNQMTGNQKWLLYCLERFLNMYDPY